MKQPGYNVIVNYGDQYSKIPEYPKMQNIKLIHLVFYLKNGFIRIL